MCVRIVPHTELPCKTNSENAPELGLTRGIVKMLTTNACLTPQLTIPNLGEHEKGEIVRKKGNLAASILTMTSVPLFLQTTME